jgi:hypothetical protein
MRLAATGLAFAAVFAVGAPVYTVRHLKDGEPAEMFDFHPPETQREHAAATLTLDFAAAMQRDDAKAACRLVAGHAARVLRCARAHPRVVSCGHQIYEAKESDDDAVDVKVAFCSVKVQRGKVIEWQEVGGLA